MVCPPVGERGLIILLGLINPLAEFDSQADYLKEAIIPHVRSIAKTWK
jgi:hypothetical protein